MLEGSGERVAGSGEVDIAATRKEVEMESILHRFGGGCLLSSWFGLVLEVIKGILEGSEGW